MRNPTHERKYVSTEEKRKNETKSCLVTVDSWGRGQPHTLRVRDRGEGVGLTLPSLSGCGADRGAEEVSLQGVGLTLWGGKGSNELQISAHLLLPLN